MPYNCEALGGYQKIDCQVDKFSYNRVVAIGIIKNAAKDYTLPATWAEYVTLEDPLVPGVFVANIADDISIIPATYAEYDGGSPEVTPGYGDQLEVIDSNKHTIAGDVEYNKKNIGFFNGSMKSAGRGLVLISGSFEELHLVTGVSPTVIPRMPITRELEKHRRYQFDITWSKIELPPVVDVSQAVRDLFR